MCSSLRYANFFTAVKLTAVKFTAVKNAFFDRENPSELDIVAWGADGRQILAALSAPHHRGIGSENRNGT